MCFAPFSKNIIFNRENLCNVFYLNCSNFHILSFKLHENSVFSDASKSIIMENQENKQPEELKLPESVKEESPKQKSVFTAASTAPQQAEEPKVKPLNCFSHLDPN